MSASAVSERNVRFDLLVRFGRAGVTRCRAQLGEGVELACGRGASSSSSGGSTFSLISFTVTETFCFEPSASSNSDLLRGHRRSAREARASISSTTARAEARRRNRAAPHPAAKSCRRRRCRRGRPPTSTGTSSATVERRASSSRSTRSCGTSGSYAPTSSVVQSGEVRLRRAR